MVGKGAKTQPRADAMASKGAPIVVASNRGPVQFYQRANGRVVPGPASGGLASALASVAGQVDISWIAVASTEAERQAFAQTPQRIARIGSARIPVHYLPVPERVYKLHYDDVSNKILWFLQHYLFEPDITPTFKQADRDHWENGYVAVNRAMADTIIAGVQSLPLAARRQAIVMLQDYHLYLVAGMVRAALPRVALTHFIHIPWPETRYWQFLPWSMLEQILTSLLANDVIGFQTTIDVRNFLTCVTELLPRARVSYIEGRASVAWEGRRVQVKAYPIGIDPARIRALANSRAAQRGYRAIAAHFDEKTILRVDRMEPTKNIVRGLEAFALMLEQHPTLVGKARFVMILVPSREEVSRYRRYSRAVYRLVQEINARYAATCDTPVVITVLGNDQARALAAMRRSEVMLVNSVIDGMHLGAKEYAIANECDGVLALSNTTGIARELDSTAALYLTPTDLQETADVLFKALTLDVGARQEMAQRARQCVEAHTVLDWLQDQLRDVRDVARHRPTPRSLQTPVR